MNKIFLYFIYRLFSRYLYAISNHLSYPEIHLKCVMWQDKDYKCLLNHFIYTTSCNKFKIVKVKSKLILSTTPFLFMFLCFTMISIRDEFKVFKSIKTFYKSVAHFCSRPSLFNKTSFLEITDL